jgi:hypothetical protein
MEREPTVADMMAAYAEDAVDHAQSAVGIALDYSPESIRNVEAVLEKLHAALPKGFLGRLFGKGPSADDLDRVSKMYGGYVGEVIRRAGGGEWVFDTEIMPGQKVICLTKGDTKIWPPAKVYKRLTNGPEDSVWHYSQVIMKDWK